MMLSSKPGVRVLEHDRVVNKTIQLGLKDSLNAQVLSGLNDGDSIILGDSKAAKLVRVIQAA